MAYFTLNVYTNDAKSTLVGSTTNIQDATSDRQLLEPYTYTITTFNTEAGMATVDTTMYAEIMEGWGTQTLWGNGYVHRVTKAGDGSNLVTIELESALRALRDFRDLDSLTMQYGQGYLNVIDSFNGINAPGTGATPGTKGLFSDSGWQVVWVDPTAPAHASTIATLVHVGDVTINVASTSGWTQGNAFKVGNDFYQISSIVDGTHITIHPAATATYAVSTACGDMGYQLPGVGDSWFTALQDAITNAKAQCARYHIYGRERIGSLARNGVLEIGPLGDPSGLAIWGGKSLRDDLATNHSINLPEPNYGKAQELGYAVTDGPTYEDARDQLVDILWAVGTGTGHNEVTLRTYMTNVVGADGVTPAAGVTRQQYWNGGRYYYFGPTKANWNGNTFQIVAAQRNDSTWEYGVANTTAIGKWTPKEKATKFLHCQYPNVLLSNAIGAVDYLGDIVPSWTFPVLHPRLSASQVPLAVVPGQTIAVHYSGHVQTAGGDVTYLDFPGAGMDASQVAKLNKCVEIAEHYTAGGGYSAVYTMGRGKLDWKGWRESVEREIEKGRNNPTAKHWFKRENFDGVPFWYSQNPTAYEDQAGRRTVLNPGSMTVSDVPTPQFFDDHTAVRFTVTILDDTQCVDFLFMKPMGGVTQTDITGQTDANGNQLYYGLLRFAATNYNGGTASSNRCGFFTTVNGTEAGLTFRGYTPRGPFLDGNNRLLPGIYDVTLHYRGGHYHCTMSAQMSADGTSAHHVTRHAEWYDTGTQATSTVAASPSPTTTVFGVQAGNGKNFRVGSPVVVTHSGTKYTSTIRGIAGDVLTVVPALGATPSSGDAVAQQQLQFPAAGAIGWRALGGSSQAFVSGVHMHPHHEPVHKRQNAHPHYSNRHNWHNMVFRVHNWDGNNATIRIKLTKQPGSPLGQLLDDSNQLLYNEDGTPCQWSTQPADVGGMQHGTMFVYNATGITISDGTHTVAPKAFGVVSLVYATTSVWDNVFLIGRLSDDVDPHTNKPRLIGWHSHAHEHAGYNLAKQGVGKRHQHPTTPTTKFRRFDQGQSNALPSGYAGKIFTAIPS